MEEFNIQFKQTSFYKYCPGTFRYTLVYRFVFEKVKFQHSSSSLPIDLKDIPVFDTAFILVVYTFFLRDRIGSDHTQKSDEHVGH